MNCLQFMKQRFYRKKKNVACIFAHYHEHGLLGVSTHDLLEYLLKTTTRVILVSTNLNEDEKSKVPAGVEIIVRENIGYDFYSYKIGLNMLGDISIYTYICFLNNSFICTDPPKLIGRVFTQLENSADMFGITFSRENSLHIQSYFLVFSSAAMETDALGQWWKNITPISDRLEVIKTYELGLSNFLLENAFTISALFNPSPQARVAALQHAITLGIYQPIYLEDGTPSIDIDLADQLNPSHFMWDSLWSEFGIIKRELLTKNPFQIDLSKLNAEQLKKLRDLC